MTARKTRCLTWGETRRTGGALTNGNGQRVGFLDFEVWVTLCGKYDEDPSEACALDHDKPRPIGVCRVCWKQYRIATQEARMRQIFRPIARPTASSEPSPTPKAPRPVTHPCAGWAMPLPPAPGMVPYAYAARGDGWCFWWGAADDPGEQSPENEIAWPFPEDAAERGVSRASVEAAGFKVLA